jgi:hypothetical protein
VGIGRIEDILDAQKLEGQGDEENVVRGVAALDDIETPPKVDPPGVEEFQ